MGSCRLKINAVGMRSRTRPAASPKPRHPRLSRRRARASISASFAAILRCRSLAASGACWYSDRAPRSQGMQFAPPSILPDGGGTIRSGVSSALDTSERNSLVRLWSLPFVRHSKSLEILGGVLPAGIAIVFAFTRSSYISFSLFSSRSYWPVPFSPKNPNYCGRLKVWRGRSRWSTTR